MADSMEVQIARIDEQVKQMIRAMSSAEMSRRDNYKQLETMNMNYASIDARLSVVEDGMTKNAPTIEEFITIKHKVVGAGMAGRWLWAIGAFLLGIAATAVTGLKGILP